MLKITYNTLIVTSEEDGLWYLAHVDRGSGSPQCVLDIEVLRGDRSLSLSVKPGVLWSTQEPKEPKPAHYQHLFFVYWL